MEVHLRRPLSAEHYALLARRLQEIDPAAVVDTDVRSGRPRLNTFATTGELVGILGSIDPALSAADLEYIPSVCCGGCAG